MGSRGDVLDATSVPELMEACTCVGVGPWGHEVGKGVAVGSVHELMGAWFNGDTRWEGVLLLPLFTS